MLVSPYAAPHLARPDSLRWWPCSCATCWSGASSPIPSLIGNIAEPLIWLVAFGYGMGALVGDASRRHVPYILFLASGSSA